MLSHLQLTAQVDHKEKWWGQVMGVQWLLIRLDN